MRRTVTHLRGRRLLIGTPVENATGDVLLTHTTLGALVDVQTQRAVALPARLAHAAGRQAGRVRRALQGDVY